MPLASDDFLHGTDRWIVELEHGGEVFARDGALTIDVPAGCTVWFNKPFQSPVQIDYDANVVDAGGSNDRVSDLNCFWMARDARSPEDFFGTKRSGAFSDYDQLRCYYVGVGGNQNTTTRFRRYMGEKDNRPLLPQHDLRPAAALLQPNHSYHIRLIANGNAIQFVRDGELLFDFNDVDPYRSGYFGFRTVHSHLQIRNFIVTRRG